MKMVTEVGLTVKIEGDRRLLFVTKYGGSWAKDTSANPISAEFRRLLKQLRLHRQGLSFYALRHGSKEPG